MSVYAPVAHRKLELVSIGIPTQQGPAATIPAPEAAIQGPELPDPAHYAEKIRAGDVCDIPTARMIGDIARGITTFSYGQGEEATVTYSWRDGRVIPKGDAELLLAMSRPDSWTFSEETEQDLLAVRDRLASYHERDGELQMSGPIVDVLDPRIPFEDVEAILAVKDWLAKTLAIVPHGVSIDELVVKIDGRISLSEQIVSRMPQPVPEAAASDAEPAAASTALGALTVVLTAGPAVSGIDPFAGLTPVGTPPHPTPPLLRQAAYPEPQDRYHHKDVTPSASVSTQIRSHRRGSRAPGRRYPIAAAVVTAAALAAIGSFTVRSGHSEAADSEPVVEIAPSTSRPNVLTPSATQPAQQPVQQPEQQAGNNTERIIVLGQYDPASESGTIGNVVKNDAVQLGYANLTREQNVELIDLYLQYMDTRFPGGMSRERAYRLPDDAALPYPSMNTVRTWIGEILAETSQGAAANSSASSAPNTAAAAGARQAQHGIAETASQAAADYVQGSLAATKQSASVLPQFSELRKDTKSSVLALPVTVPLLIGKSFFAHKRALTRDTDPKMLRGLYASGRALWDAVTGAKR